MKRSYKYYYEQLERDHWWWKARRKIVLNELLNLNSENKKRLLDIGSGTGINLKSFTKHFECEGIEPDKELAKVAEKNSKVKVHIGSLPDKLPKTNKKYDFITLLDVLEHVKQDDRSLKSIAKYLKKSGYLIINVPAMTWLWSIHDEVNKHTGSPSIFTNRKKIIS
jgi:2-polyprenyl-3-methyl-5-hydroxy-6-metoxy-1,4-benzoquinol methylase